MDFAKYLKLSRSNVRHLGTEINLKVLQIIYAELKKIYILYETEVINITIAGNITLGILLENSEKVHGRKLVITPGRGGSI